MSLACLSERMLRARERERETRKERVRNLTLAEREMGENEKTVAERLKYSGREAMVRV